MDYVLKSILDLDKQARAKKEKAIIYRKEIFANIEADKKKIMEEELASARKKVETIGESFKKGAEKRIRDLKIQYDKHMDELYIKQTENSKRWSDELYERILR